MFTIHFDFDDCWLVHPLIVLACFQFFLISLCISALRFHHLNDGSNHAFWIPLRKKVHALFSCFLASVCFLVLCFLVMTPAPDSHSWICSLTFSIDIVDDDIWKCLSKPHVESMLLHAPAPSPTCHRFQKNRFQELHNNIYCIIFEFWIISCCKTKSDEAICSALLLCADEYNWLGLVNSVDVSEYKSLTMCVSVCSLMSCDGWV